MTDTADRRGVFTTTSSATVRMPEASIAKTVTPGSAAVGELVTYTLTTTLPASTNFYDAVLTDTLPVGVEYVASAPHTETANWAGAPNAPTIGAPTVNGRTLTWSIGPDDIAAWTTNRSIVITFQARLMPGVAAAAPSNSATFAWSAVNGSTAPGDRKTPTATANVTILNPSVTIAKTVKLAADADSTYAATKAGNPDQGFTYRVRVTNATGAGTAPAHGIVVTDTVDAGVRIDTTQAVFADATFSDETAIREGRGGVITWTLAGPLSNLANANVRDLVYRGTFVASTGLRATGLNNVARVTQYSSAASDGWTYRPGTGTRPGGAAVSATNTSATATVTPQFPSVALTKSVTAGSQAFIGEPLSWTLQARNTGAGAAQTVVLTDTLPANWEYDSSVIPRIGVGGQATTDLAAPTITTQAGRQVLTWTVGSATGPALLPGTVGSTTDAQRTVAVTFSAKPLADAVTSAGSGLSVNHVNALAGSATDTTGVTRNGTGQYVTAGAVANAQIARADLKIVKSAIGGDEQGAWTAGDSARAAVAGRGAYAQPQWRLTVTNQGPDAANGPFLVTDDATLPAGVTTGAFTARYYGGAQRRAVGGHRHRRDRHRPGGTRGRDRCGRRRGRGLDDRVGRSGRRR